MRAEQVLLESRRRLELTDAAVDRSGIEAVRAAATLAAFGPDDPRVAEAIRPLRDAARATELGRVAADMDLDCAALHAMLTRAEFSVPVRGLVFAGCCNALAERGAITPAIAALVRYLETRTKPEDELIIATVVIAALQSGDVSAAIIAATHAKHPRDVGYCNYLIVSELCRLQRVDEAVARLKKVRSKEWNAGAVGHVAVAHVESGQLAAALTLLESLDAARVTAQLTKVATAMIGSGRVDEAFDMVERLRTAVGSNRPTVLEQLLIPLIEHGEHERALATVAQLGDARSTARSAWMTVLAGIGRRAEAEALALPEWPYIAHNAIAVGLAAAGDLPEALRTAALTSLSPPNAVAQRVRDHIATLAPHAAIEWLLRMARETGRADSAGDLLNEVKRGDDAALVEQVAAAFAQSPFTPFWLGQLFEQAAWQALARRDHARAHRALLEVARLDTSREQHLGGAWGRLAARMLADGGIVASTGVDALFDAIASPIVRALAWAEAARELALIELGKLTTQRRTPP